MEVIECTAYLLIYRISLRAVPFLRTTVSGYLCFMDDWLDIGLIESKRLE